MTLPTHVGFGAFSFLLVSLFLGLGLNPLLVVIACITSLLPDLDYPSSTIGRALPFLSERLERRFGHRTFTHSLLGLLVFGALSFPLWFIRHQIWLAAMIGYFSHIFLDCTNKSGLALFYPDGVQAVLPAREEFRFVHGGKGEAILFFILLGLNLATFPIVNIGLIKTLHYLRADSESAVADFRDWAKDYEVFCDLRGIDALTNKLVEGRFKVVGTVGVSTLIISNSGHLRSVGIKDNVNIRAIKVRVKKKERINMVVFEIDLRGGFLGDLVSYVDSGKEHYLFGILSLGKRIPLEERPDRLSTFLYVNNNLVLDYADWQEIKRMGLEAVEVKEGVVLVKTILKPGDTLKVKEETAGFNERQLGKFFKVSFTVEDPEDILVKNGQVVKRGEALAKMSAEDEQELVRLKGELAYQEELFNEGLVLEKAKDEVWDKMQKIELDYRRQKLSRFNGKVTGVEFGEVKDGMLKVEVGILSEEG